MSNLSYRSFITSLVHHKPISRTIPSLHHSSNFPFITSILHSSITSKLLDSLSFPSFVSYFLLPPCSNLFSSFFLIASPIIFIKSTQFGIIPSLIFTTFHPPSFLFPFFPKYPRWNSPAFHQISLSFRTLYLFATLRHFSFVSFVFTHGGTVQLFIITSNHLTDEDIQIFCLRKGCRDSELIV